jgi:hypothetical protein
MKTIRTCRNSEQDVLGDSHRRGGGDITPEILLPDRMKISKEFQHETILQQLRTNMKLN